MLKRSMRAGPTNFAAFKQPLYLEETHCVCSHMHSCIYNPWLCTRHTRARSFCLSSYDGNAKMPMTRLSNPCTAMNGRHVGGAGERRGWQAPLRCTMWSHCTSDCDRIHPEAARRQLHTESRSHQRAQDDMYRCFRCFSMLMVL